MTPYIKRKRRRKTGCPTRKICYEGEDAAKQQLDLIRFFGLPWRQENSYYQCPVCGKWHLTSEIQEEIKHER